MSRTWCMIGCIAVLALAAAAANAETAHVIGMGEVTLTDTTASAWFSPWMLPHVDHVGPGAGTLAGPASFTLAMDDTVSWQAFDLSLHTGVTRGFGIGYTHMGGGLDTYGFGYGQPCSFADGLSWGVGGVLYKGPGVDEFITQLGFGYRRPFSSGTVTGAVIVWDVLERQDRDFSAGFRVDFNNGLAVAMDWWDISDWDGLYFGGEYTRNRLTFLAGSADSEPTLGAKYKYRSMDFTVSCYDVGGENILFGGVGGEL